MSIYFIPIVTLLGAALFRYRSIRALCRPISPCGLNTGFWLRLLPVGQYAFAVALFRPMGSIRALVARGCATLTPGCILAPHQGALFPLSQTSHLPQADVNSPSQFMERESGGEVNSPSQFMERGSGGEVNDWG